jgi:hypothetical protein
VNTVRFRPGIADDEFTEVLTGGLQEGDEVVVEATGGNQSAPPSGGLPGSGQRGRGPRFY